ncbi:MAG: hypothetical protein ACREEM_29290 [Blastocatellia bacterium]
MALPQIKIVMEEVTDPEEINRAQAQHQRYERNLAWLNVHFKEVYTQYRGKFICVAGEELFVGDTPRQVIDLARAAHPEDDGRLIRYIYPKKFARIYANVIIQDTSEGSR